MKKVTLQIITCIFLLISLLFTACKIGLGETVDILPPDVAVVYPSPSETVIIRDSFIMHGTVSDDFAVESVEVSFAGKEGGSQHKAGPYFAKIDAQAGTWKIENLNAKLNDAYPIKDAEYTVTVTATDNAGQKTSVGVNYEIDNTSPVVVMESPGSDNTADPKVFGTSIKIMGKAADPNIEKILFTAYEKNENGYTKLDEKEILQQGNQSINTVVGEYSPSNELEEYYNKIYGFETTGAKEIFYSIKSYDTAREYKGAGATGTGNMSAEYYLNDDVSTLAVSAEDLYFMKNGSSVNENADSILLNMQTMAKKESEIESVTVDLAVFTIQPVSHPTFELVGSEIVTNVTKGNLPSNGINSSKKLQVKIIPNKDAVPVDYKKITIFAKQLASSVNGAVTEATTYEYIYQLYPLEDTDANGNANNITLKDDSYIISLDQKGVLYEGSLPDARETPKALPSPESLPYGSFIIDVIGVDKALNDDNTPKTVNGTADGELVGNYVNDDYYGFERISPDTPPKVTVNKIGDIDFSNNSITIGKLADSKKATVTATIEAFIEKTGPKINSATYTLKPETISSSDSQSRLVQSLDNPAKYTLEFDLDHSIFGSPTKTNTYTVEISATDCDGRTTTTKAEITYDVEAPVINDDDFRYTVDANEVTVSVNASDDIDLGAASYNVLVDDEAKIKKTTDKPSTFNFTFTPSDIGINNADGSITSESLVKVVANITDAAGNSTEKTLVLDTTKPTLSGAQISSQNSPDYTDSGNKNWYKSAVLDVSVPAEDHAPTNGIVSGIDTVEWTIAPNPADSDWKPLQSSGSTWTGTVNFGKTGDYTVQFRAKDIANNTSDVVSLPLSIDVDRPSAPTTSNASTIFSNKEKVIEVALSNVGDVGSGVEAITLKSIGSTSYNSAITLEDDKFTISTEQLETATSGAVIITVTDNVGNSRDVTLFSLTIDTVVPKVSIVSPSLEQDKTDVNGTLAIVVSASDTSGIDRVALQKKNGDEWETIETLTDGSKGWNFEITSSDYSDGSVYFRALAIDNIGNEANSTDLKITISQDADRPIITMTNIDVTDMTSSNYVKLKDTQIRGSVQDDDGIAIFEISKNGADYEEVSVSADGSWVYPETGELSDGEYSFSFKVTDTNGTTFEKNESSSPKLTDATDSNLYVTIDNDAPTIEKIEINTTDDEDNWKILDDGYLLGGTSSTFKLRITASDTLAVKSFLVKNGNDDLGCTFTEKSSTEDGAKTVVITETDELDSSSEKFENGNQYITVSVTDGAENISSRTKQIVVDNNGPQLPEITSHENNAQVTGTVILEGMASDGSTSAGISSVKFTIPTVNGNTWTQPKATDAVWTDVNSATSAFTLKFDGTDLPTLTSYVDDSNGDNRGISTDGGITWKLPIVFRLEDRLGNVTVTDVDYFQFVVDPNGDKPTVAVTYPLQSDSTEPVTLGGTVSIFGSADDNEAIATVYMQIDTDNDGDFDAVDKSFLTDNGYSVSTINPDSSVEGSDTDSWEGLEVNGKNSWNFKLNKNNEFNEKEHPIKFRVRSVDVDGAVSAWSDFVSIQFDANVPTIGESQSLTLVQYESGNSGTIAKQQAYVDDMWISGEWYLVGSIEDSKDIKNIDVTGDLEATETDTWFTKKDDFVNDKNGYIMNIPLGTDSKNLTFTISAIKDNDTQLTTTRVISINRDNTAPDANSSLQTRGSVIDTLNKVQESDTNFTFGSTVTESGGGLSHIAFWFERDVAGETDDRIYNPLEERKNDANRTNLQRSTIASGKVGIINNLPRLHLDAVIRDSEDTLEHSSIENNRNVRVGGLVTIAGVDRRIDAVDYGTGTIMFSPSVETTYTTADIAYVMLVNNQDAVETVKDDGSISNDDGDGMLEFIERKNGDEYTWTASINSKNIPDGPIAIHYVAYDMSGNVAVGTTATSVVSNNAPAIAKVWLGTDLNDDNSVTDDEKVEYSTFDDSNKPVNKASVDASDFTAKGTTHIIPEIVGGNGNLYYQFASSDLKNLRIGDSGAVSAIPVTLGIDTITKDGTGYPREIGLTIWDSTEESTVGNADSGSQSAYLDVTMHVDLVDDVAPVVAITPFYWTSETDNSLYENSRKNGHIELPVTVSDNPKVSGKITFTGTVSDDKIITAIKAKINEFKSDYVTLATFNGTAWSVPNATDIASAGWKFEIEGTPTQEGHTATWQLHWDSAKITGMVGENKTISISATDKSTISSTDAEYGFDVVPYITSVETELSKARETNARTALGNYVVRDGESVTIKGFNFAEKKVTANYATEVDSINSINNGNDNTAEYNKTPMANNDDLTDDIVFDVWDFNTVATKTGADLKYPEMKINPSTGAIGHAYADMYYYRMSENSIIFTSEKGKGPYFESALAYNPAGYRFGVSSNEDKNVGEGSFSTLFYNDGSKNILGTGIDNNTIRVKRMYTPSLAATNSGVYLAYFDAIKNELRYQYGIVNNGKISGGQLNNSVSNTITDAAPGNYSIIAKLDNGIDYVSLDARTIDNKDMVVITWYDKSNGTLMMAYNNTPKTDSNVIEYSDDKDAGKTGWVIKEVDSGNSGLYNSVKIDAAGGIHIAYHTTSGLDLKYAYLSSVDATPQIVTVDSFGATGKNIRLDVAKVVDNYVPYISYYEGGIAKTARIVDVENGISDGADENGKYTGSWEVSCIPTATSIKDDTVSIGVHNGATYVSYITADGNLEMAKKK